MCTNCGYSPCGCSKPNYSSNWFNVDAYPCNPCIQTTVCKKVVPAICVEYKGPILDQLNLDSPARVETILAALNIVLGEIKESVTLESDTSETTAANILVALNDINSRLNVLEGASHAPYVI